MTDVPVPVPILHLPTKEEDRLEEKIGKGQGVEAEGSLVTAVMMMTTTTTTDPVF